MHIFKWIDAYIKMNNSVSGKLRAKLWLNFEEIADF